MDYTNQFLKICAKSSLDYIQKFIADHPQIITNPDYCIIFRELCICDRKDVVQWLLQIHDAIPCIAHHVYTDLKWAFYMEKIWLAHMILDKYTSLDFYPAIATSFIFACKIANIIVIDWIHNNYAQSLTIQDQISAFVQACWSSNIETIRKIYDLYPDMHSMIDIDAVFVNSYKNRKHETIMWIIGTFPRLNIHADNEAAFIYMCNSKRYDIARRLADVTDLDDVFYHVDNKHAYIMTRDETTFCWPFKELTRVMDYIIYGYPKDQYSASHDIIEKIMKHSNMNRTKSATSAINL